jgi:hypothetical protein
MPRLRGGFGYDAMPPPRWQLVAALGWKNRGAGKMAGRKIAAPEKKNPAARGRQNEGCSIIIVSLA